jgi:peptide-methionine (R)-S-oxide reductase
MRGSVVILILVVAAFAVGSAATRPPKFNVMNNASTPAPDQPEACDTACGLPTSDEELRKLLTPEQYRITKQNGTERPFQNAYWNNHRAGLYVCVISGTPLFSSTDKFESNSGWPSFTKPIEAAAVIEKRDISHGMVRTEVRAAVSDSHLGHVFSDGPAPTGLRYCINSAALRFIPVEELEQQGHGKHAALFAKR